MNIPLLFKQYIWLVETIRNARKITLAEINRKWVDTDMSCGMEMARTTFFRYKEAIQDIFGLIIECDRKNGYGYYIVNEEVLEEDSVQNWMLSTMSISNMIGENVSMQDRILLESVPSGNAILQDIIKAMRDNHRVMITYRRYGAAAANSFSAAPYCVKLFRRRWYVLVKIDRPSYQDKNDKNKKDDGYMAVFSLDRIEEIAIQKSKFKLDKKFDAASFFDECFGIVVGDGSKPVRIVLRAYGLEPHYLNDLPIHHSQRVIKKSEEYTDFELFMRATSDLKAHLMSRGEWIKVISPKSLADEMKEWLNAAMKRYETDG